MIRTFKCKDTELLFEDGNVKRFRSIEKVAVRKLDYLDSAASLRELAVPPGNHLEALAGDRRGQYSLRINAQYRLCFVWQSDGACEVEIIDYHR